MNKEKYPNVRIDIELLNHINGFHRCMENFLWGEDNLKDFKNIKNIQWMRNSLIKWNKNIRIKLDEMDFPRKDINNLNQMTNGGYSNNEK
jgi:predicted DNA binding CopG/RHH family protein